MAPNPPSPATADDLTPPPATAPPPSKSGNQRDFLLHLEAYLSRRDGVDKLLKISRYASKVILASSLSRNPRLKAFESSVGVSRKAFRLGKFVQDLNAFRLSSAQSPSDRALAVVAYGGEGVYYFVEQFVWLAKAGLIPSEYSKRLQMISAWAELIGYVGSIAMKVEDVRKINSRLESKMGGAKGSDEAEEDGEARKLREKLLLKRLSIVQDLADALMALADVRDGNGMFTGPLLMASAGLLSALISTHKNWNSC